MKVDPEPVPRSFSSFEKSNKSNCSVLRSSDMILSSSKLLRRRTSPPPNFECGEASRFIGKRDLPAIQATPKKKDLADSDKSHSDPEQSQDSTKPKKSRDTKVTNKTIAISKYCAKKKKTESAIQNTSRSLTDIRTTLKENNNTQNGKF